MTQGQQTTSSPYEESWMAYAGMAVIVYRSFFIQSNA